MAARRMPEACRKGLESLSVGLSKLLLWRYLAFIHLQITCLRLMLDDVVVVFGKVAIARIF